MRVHKRIIDLEQCCPTKEDSRREESSIYVPITGGSICFFEVTEDADPATGKPAKATVKFPESGSEITNVPIEDIFNTGIELKKGAKGTAYKYYPKTEIDGQPADWSQLNYVPKTEDFKYVPLATGVSSSIFLISLEDPKETESGIRYTIKSKDGRTLATDYDPASYWNIYRRPRCAMKPGTAGLATGFGSELCIIWVNETFTVDVCMVDSGPEQPT